MAKPDDEERQLRSVALQNASTILAARQRADEELRRTQEALRQSQERLRAALTAAGTGTFRWDIPTNVVEWDGNLDVLLGLDSDSPLALDTFMAAVHPDDYSMVQTQLERCARLGCDFDLEFRVCRRDGAVRWLHVKAKAFLGEDGIPQYMTGACADVTARRDVAEALHRNELRLRDETRMLELLNETGRTLASTLDLQQLLQAVTDAATELSAAEFGAFFYNATDVQGDTLLLYTLSGAPREAFERFGNPHATPLFGPTFRGEAPVRSDDVLSDPRYGRMPPHYGMPEGHLPVRSFLAVPVRSRNGEVLGGLFFGHPDVGMFSERSERLVVGVAAQAGIAIDNARLYEAAQRAAEERRSLLESERAARTAAERMSDMKDDFLATLSHELRTPLNAILGWSQVLRATRRDSPDFDKGLETIERNARMQTQLIEDLLDMSRISSGKLRLDVQPLQPAAVIDAAIETVIHAAQARSIRIEKVLDPNAGPVSGDASRLQQVMWNLLSNAIKFTPKGGTVQVLLQRVNSHVEIAVADNGIGIRPEFIPHLFDRFRQADASTTRKYGGLGLGLSIVKSLVELHGGTIVVSSLGVNCGTTVVVQLPVSVVHANLGARGRSHPRIAGPPALAPPVAELAGLTVLVVDDQEDARELIKRVLEDCGAVVLLAPGAEEALQLVEAHRPDVLVSDIGMPDADGYTLLRQVRALGPERGGKVPAIALTAFARTEDRTRALRAGFIVHVAKPVDPAELIATVASASGRVGGPPPSERRLD